MTADADPLPIVVSITSNPVPPEPVPPASVPAGPKAGRDLRAAITIGVLLGGAVAIDILLKRNALQVQPIVPHRNTGLRAAPHP